MHCTSARTARSATPSAAFCDCRTDRPRSGAGWLPRRRSLRFRCLRLGNSSPESGLYALRPKAPWSPSRRGEPRSWRRLLRKIYWIAGRGYSDGSHRNSRFPSAKRSVSRNRSAARRTTARRCCLPARSAAAEYGYRNRLWQKRAPYCRPKPPPALCPCGCRSAFRKPNTPPSL